MHKTLITKVMMGTWGVLPSFDTYFVKGFRSLAETKGEKAAFRTVRSPSLDLMGQFYQQNKEEIDSLTERFTALDFESGELTQRRCPQAKIIDIFGFHKGFHG